MTLAANFNSTYTITRQTRTGTEDGTPIYGDSVVVVAGWFDELEVRTQDEPFRSQSIPYADRRAMFMCAANADIQQDDVGVVSIGGMDRGRWEVSVVRTAPTPGGAGHLEVQMQGAKESK
jgi:hypothetical protein